MNVQPPLKPLLLLLSSILALPVGAAEVVARISHDKVAAGQPFRLFLEAKGELASPPDLSVLSRAFEIIDRSQRRHVQLINGRSLQNANLTLTLRPKSSGKLTIPSIYFGKDRSQPIALEVTGDYQDAQPFWQAPRGPLSAGGYLPALPEQEKQAVRQTQTPTPSMALGQQPVAATNVWPWVSLILALGWAFTVGAWAASRRRQRQEAAAQVADDQRVEPITPPPPTALDIAFKQVEDACLSRDGERTKSALLDWARQLWPEDPPSNLRSLAQRCPPDVGKGILEFERVLYSPETKPWFNHPVWKRLAQVPEQTGTQAA